MLRTDSQCLLQDFDRLVEILHLLVADALKVIRIRIARIELHCLLKALQRRLQFIAGVFCEPQVVPGLHALRIQSKSGLKGLLGLVQFLQSHQRNAFIDGCLRQLWILLERLGKRVFRPFGELLAHLRHAAVVGPHRLRIKARLRPGSDRRHHKNYKSRQSVPLHQSLPLRARTQLNQ